MRIPAADPRPSELLMLALSIFVLAALAADAFLHLSPATRTILGYADFGICIVFLADFFVRLARAEDRRAFLRWGWIDLVSSIPVLEAARPGRVVRVIRTVRLLRAARSVRHIGGFLLGRRAEAAFSAAVLITVMLVTLCGIAILELESGLKGAKIRTPADAMWWAVATITTVGYGDLFPVTGAGRAIGAFLMTVGVGFFGISTGLVASWFLAPATGRQDELAQIRDQLDAMRCTLDTLRAPGGERVAPPA